MLFVGFLLCSPGIVVEVYILPVLAEEEVPLVLCRRKMLFVGFLLCSPGIVRGLHCTKGFWIYLMFLKDVPIITQNLRRPRKQASNYRFHYFDAGWLISVGAFSMDNDERGSSLSCSNLWGKSLSSWFVSEFYWTVCITEEDIWPCVVIFEVCREWMALDSIESNWHVAICDINLSFSPHLPLFANHQCSQSMSDVLPSVIPPLLGS